MRTLTAKMLMTTAKVGLIGLLVLMVLVLITAPAKADQGDVKLAVFKTADTLESIGIGVSYRAVTLTELNSLWLDAAPFYDGLDGGFGGFAGVSTEVAGLPLIRDLLKPLARVLDGGCDRVGYGYSTRSEMGMVYAAWTF